MTSAEKLERIRYLKDQGRRIVARERRETNEMRIKQALEKIRDYYVDRIEASYSPGLSRRIDYLTSLIDSMQGGPDD